MTRSENMRRIRSTDTKPELVVRRLTHSLGYRYRLHKKGLPGQPDLCFGGRKKAIFVHGCFWHQHGDCKEGRLPKSNLGYWEKKLEKNIEQDKINQKALFEMGIEVLVIWESETKNIAQLEERITNFLDAHCV